MKIPTFCINVWERPDRLVHFKNEIKNVTFIPEFILIESHRVIPGWIGCRNSYLRIFKKARNMHFFMILEDDIKFLPGAQINLGNSINQLPDDWDMLYLGGYPMVELKRYSNNLFRAMTVLTTHGIIYNTQNGLIDFILGQKEKINKIDVFFRDVIQPLFNCFITYPMVATQWENVSDVCKFSDYSFIEKQYNKFCHD